LLPTIRENLEYNYFCKGLNEILDRNFENPDHELEQKINLAREKLFQIFNQNKQDFENFQLAFANFKIIFDEDVQQAILFLGYKSIKAIAFRLLISKNENRYHEPVQNACAIFLQADSLKDFTSQLRSIALHTLIKRKAYSFFAACFPEKESQPAKSVKRKLECLEDDALSLEEPEPKRRGTFQRSGANLCANTEEFFGCRVEKFKARFKEFSTSSTQSSDTSSEDKGVKPIEEMSAIEAMEILLEEIKQTQPCKPEIGEIEEYHPIDAAVNAYLYPYIAGLRPVRSPNACLIKQLAQQFEEVKSTDLISIALTAYLRRSVIWYVLQGKKAIKDELEKEKQLAYTWFVEWSRLGPAEYPEDLILIIHAVFPTLILDFPGFSLITPSEAISYFETCYEHVMGVLKEKEQQINGHKNKGLDAMKKRRLLINRLKILSCKSKDIDAVIRSKVIRAQKFPSIYPKEKLNHQLTFTLDISYDESTSGGSRDEDEDTIVVYDYPDDVRAWYSEWNPNTPILYSEEFLGLLYELSHEIQLSPNELTHKCEFVVRELYLKEDISKLNNLFRKGIKAFWPKDVFIGGSRIFCDPPIQEHELYQWYENFVDGTVTFPRPFNLVFLKFLKVVVDRMENIIFQNDFSAAMILQHVFQLLREENKHRGHVVAGRYPPSLLSDFG